MSSVTWLDLECKIPSHMLFRRETGNQLLTDVKCISNYEGSNYHLADFGDAKRFIDVVMPEKQ